MESFIYFKGERLHNVIKCDLITNNTYFGTILFKELPNTDYLSNLLGQTGPLAYEEETDKGIPLYKHCREILFYPFPEVCWEKDLGIVSKVSYRLVQDNKIDNMAEMLGDMKRTTLAYRDGLRSINCSGKLVTCLEEFLDRLDQDEEKLKDFENLHLTTRKRLISDYSISYVEAKEKFK